MLIYSTKYDVECLVVDGQEARFKNLGFARAENERNWRGSNCASVFKGTKADHVQAVIRCKDIEAFVRMGFVANGDRLPEKEVRQIRRQKEEKLI